MLYSMYILKDRKNKLQALKKTIKDEQTDLVPVKGKIYGYIYDMKLAINEYSLKTGSSYLNNISDNINLFHTRIRNAETGRNVIDFIDLLTENLENINFTADEYCSYKNYDYINNCIISNLMANISNSSRQVTVFHPECKTGYLLNTIKDLRDNYETYGLEANNYDAEKAKEKNTRIIKGHLHGSRISNDAFDMVLCITKIKPVLIDNMINSAISKPEKLYIAQCIKYLRDNGILFIAIPYFRMYQDICKLLAKNLKNVTVCKGIEGDLENGLIYIIGQKDSSKEFDNDIYDTLRKTYNYSAVDTLSNVKFPVYNLPVTHKNIDIFKGSIIDTNELLNIVQTSGCTNSFFKKQEVKKIQENVVQPLLPFNVGQIGLVLTSGCLDGIIDEGDGHYHVVKGRVSKKVDTERSVSDGVVEEVETSSNKVEINVLLPNGDFKTLA